MAEEVQVKPGIDPRAIAHARRRIVRTGLVSVVAMVGIVAGGVVSVGALRGTTVQRALEPSSPSQTTLPTQLGLPDRGLAFVNGRLLRFAPNAIQVVAMLPERIAPVPPVLAPSGVVVLTGSPSIGLRLWLVSLDGSIKEIDHDVTAGFAVDSANDLVAYATTVQRTAPHYTTFIHIVGLRDGIQVSISPNLDFYAAVEGIVDGKVLLSTGDGASSAAGLWSPIGQEVQRYAMYGGATGADPTTGVAVLEVGDGLVPILVRFDRGPNDSLGMTPGEIVVDHSVLQLQGIDFSPGGRLIAGVAASDSGAELIVLDERTGRVRFRAALPGASQAVWSGKDMVFVLDTEGSRAVVHPCDVSTGHCVIGSVSVGDPGPYGYGVWLVRGSS